MIQLKIKKTPGLLVYLFFHSYWYTLLELVCSFPGDSEQEKKKNHDLADKHSRPSKLLTNFIKLPFDPCKWLALNFSLQCHSCITH